MAAIFLDCTDDLLGLWRDIQRPGDPQVVVNMAAGQPADVPGLLGGYATCVIDHTFLDAGLLRSCTDLRRIVFLGTGAASYIDLAAAAQRGIAVDTIKGYGDTTVAEHTLALVLAAARDVARMDRRMRAGGWWKTPGMQLKDKVLGIIGLGGVGKEIARLGAGIGMTVRGWNRTPLPGTTIALASLDEVLATADVLCVALALNEETRGFLDRERLRRTKPGVVLINTARADIVVADALLELLRSGHIRHAGIDVFSPEPPRPDDPLLALDNVTLTAHAAFMTPEATRTMLRTAMDLVIAAEAASWDARVGLKSPLPPGGESRARRTLCCPRGNVVVPGLEAGDPARAREVGLAALRAPRPIASARSRRAPAAAGLPSTVPPPICSSSRIRAPRAAA